MAIAPLLSLSLQKEVNANTIFERRCQLQSTDETLTDGSLFDRHVFVGSAGQSITALLESQDFDPYVLLFDASGKKIGENDDISPSNINARLTVTLPNSGPYTLIANSYDELGLGAYRLLLTSPTQTTHSNASPPEGCRS